MPDPVRLGQPGPDSLAEEARRFLSELLGYAHRPSKEALDIQLVADMFRDWYALGAQYEQAQATIAALRAENRALRDRVGLQSSWWHYMKFLVGIEPCPNLP